MFGFIISASCFLTFAGQECLLGRYETKRGVLMSENVTAAGNAPARDGNIAIQEELDLAIEQGSVAALELFMLRHPDHPLAIVAQKHLDQMKSNN